MWKLLEIIWIGNDILKLVWSRISSGLDDSNFYLNAYFWKIHGKNAVRAIHFFSMNVCLFGTACCSLFGMLRLAMFRVYLSSILRWSLFWADFFFLARLLAGHCLNRTLSWPSFLRSSSFTPQLFPNRARFSSKFSLVISSVLITPLAKSTKIPRNESLEMHPILYVSCLYHVQP